MLVRVFGRWVWGGKGFQGAVQGSYRFILIDFH